MATHDDSELKRWVDDRMDSLEPNADHQPDVDRHLAEVRAHGPGKGRPSTGTCLVAAGVVAWVGVMVFTLGPFSSSDEPAGATGGPLDRTGVKRALPSIAATAADTPPRRTDEPHLIPIAERDPAPGFSLPDLDGDHSTLADYAGRVLLLNFWATWCQPCRAEMPWFVEFQSSFQEEGFAVLGVSIDEPGWDIVRPFLERQPVNYRIALADTLELQAPFGQMTILPTTWLIDRNGRIAAEHIGLVSRTAVESEIQLLLNE